ncbi:MAG: hypothetical protein V4695_07235 [Pseudomonadota bacterium]
MHGPAFAQAQAAKPFSGYVNSAVGGAIEKSLIRRGFAANDPVITKTLSATANVVDATAVASGVATSIALIAGAPVWATVAIGLGVAAIGGGIAWGVYKMIQKPIAPGRGQAPVEAVSITDTESISSGNIPNYFTLPLPKTQSEAYARLIGKGPGLQAREAPWWLTTGTVFDLVPFATGRYSQGSNKFPISSGNDILEIRQGQLAAQGSSTVFVDSETYPQVTNGQGDMVTKLTTSNGTTQILPFYREYPDLTQAPDVVNRGTLDEALTDLGPAALSAPLSPQTVADIANTAWSDAASKPGYEGASYTPADPITATDVNNWKVENPNLYPTGNDLLTPTKSPTQTTTQISPTNAPQTGQTTSPTTTPTPTPSPTVNVTVDLGPNPGVVEPALDTPTAESILDPIFNLFPTLRNWIVPVHTSECPKGSFNVFGQVIQLDAQCAIIEPLRPQLQAAGLLAFTFVAMFIVLAA